MKRKQRPKSRIEGEPGNVEILTVGWMLMVVTTLACEIGFVISRGLADGGAHLMVLSGLLLFAALVIGTLALILTPIVLRNRRARPPAGIVFFAAVVSAIPLGIVAVEALHR